MTNYPKVAEINLETGETIVREKTEDEKALYDADQVIAAATLENEKKIALEKQNLLSKLGITEDEARLLLS
jgi:hypothetical protein